MPVHTSNKVLRVAVRCVLCRPADLLSVRTTAARLERHQKDSADTTCHDILRVKQGHMYDDDDAGTKVPLTRIRPSFVARLRRSNSDSGMLEADPAESTNPSEPAATASSSSISPASGPSHGRLVGGPADSSFYYQYVCGMRSAWM